MISPAKMVKNRDFTKKNRDLINKDVMIQAANLCGFQPTWGFKHQRFIGGLTNKTRDLSKKLKTRDLS
jgi:hypothetical protein